MNKGIKGKLAAFFGYIGTLAADTNVASVDTKDINSVGFLVQVGAFSFTGVNKVGLKLQHSDDNSTFTDVDAIDYEGGAMKELSAAGDASKVHAVGYIGIKRYVRLVLDVSGTVSVSCAVTGISTDPEYKPAI